MASTDVYNLPLPPDSLLVKDAPKIIRESNTATDAALADSARRVTTAEAAAGAAANSAREAADLVDAPADTVVAALLAGSGGATAAALLANRATPFQGPLKHWRDALLNQRAAAVTVVNTGSSTANGGNVTTPNRTWFSRLAAALGPLPVAFDLAAPKPAAGVQVYNTALGGTNSATYLPAAKQNAILALKPTLILHTVGSNDWANGTTPAVYKTNVRDRVVQFMNGTAALQVLIHQQPRFDVAKPLYPWAEYGKALAAIAAEFPGRVLFLNLSERFEVMGSGANPYSLWHADRVHLMDEGNKILADMIGEFLGVPTTYLPRTLVPFTGAPAGGSLTASRTLAEVRIPARPYLQQAVFHASIYAGADSGISDLELVDASNAAAPALLGAVRIQPSRSNTSSATPVTIPPHTEAVLQVRVQVYPGASLYVTTSPSFASIFADVSPL